MKKSEKVCIVLFNIPVTPSRKVAKSQDDILKSEASTTYIHIVIPSNIYGYTVHTICATVRA